VVDAIQKSFPDFDWVWDKRVQGGCSLRRPDLLLDLGTHVIIVEVDENKHTDYECICENRRIMELSKDLLHRPIILIRFNPDAYINDEGIFVKSCWKENKQGILHISKNRQKEWNERIDCLEQCIQYWIDHPTEKTVEPVELFF
jgi:hypothetical protein